MQKPLGPMEAQLLAYAQMRRFEKVRSGDLRAPLRLTALQEKQLLSRMAQKKILVRLIRGIYLIPPRLPLGGVWTPGEIAAIDALMQTCGGRYQICGPNTFNRYGWDTQIPNRTYLYNNRFSGQRTIGAIHLQLIKVPENRLGGTVEFPVREERVAIYSSRARALVDAVYDWSRFNGLPRGFEWIQQDLAEKRVRADELVDMAIKFGNQAVIRRMGALLERLKSPETVLARLSRRLSPARSTIPWIPGRPKRGQLAKHWGVVING